jgi:hypothetical protein
MEQNRLTSSQIDQLVKIFDNLMEIDDQLWNILANSTNVTMIILRNARDGISISMDEIRKILDTYE